MVIRKKASVLAAIKEVVAGTPTLPTNISALPLRPDFEMSPEFETLDNEELKNSLGASKKLLGSENPTGSGSFYFREADAGTHEYDELYRNFFGSAAVASGAETTCDAASTVSNIVLTGAATHPKGVCIIVKHANSPWEMRPVESVNGVNIVPAFDLNVAPVAGTKIAKHYYYPMSNNLDETLSVWYFHGNGGAVEMMTGARVSEIATTFEAGQYIDQSISFEAAEYYFDPMNVTATDVAIDFSDDGIGELNASVAAKFYKDPYDLADAMAIAMNTLTTDTITVDFSRSTGKYTFTSDGATFEIYFATGTNVANTIGDVIGFAADQTAALTYTGTAMIWDASNYGMAAPEYSTKDPEVAKYNEVFVGIQSDNFCFHASTMDITASLDIADKPDVCAVSGKSGKEATGRTVVSTMSTLLEKHEAAYFKQFREGDEISLAYNHGTRLGGNWVDGSSGCEYFGSATITSFALTDADNLVQLDLEVTAFVNADSDAEYVRSFSQSA